jgi:NTP pyrophosphatase (non-canonical NTP hydrolase)
MNLNKYQELSKRTLPAHENEVEIKHALANYSLGLVCESGEVGDHIKKHVFHLHELNVEEVTKELGDVFHYLSGIATILGLSLNDIAQANIEKLNARYPNGFNPQDSINRTE